MALVMGVVNVTPDSFSDGGQWFDHERAIAHGERLMAEGADILDVGGESTRPGAVPVDVAEELRRVVPVVEALAARARQAGSRRVEVSIDTRKPEVAEAAIAAGATILNDVTATLHRVAAAGGAGWIAMHSRGVPAIKAWSGDRGDVVTEARDHLVARAAEGVAAGVRRVWIDPGIGFVGSAEADLTLLGHLDAFVATGWDVAVGSSRKSFLGPLSAQDGSPAPPSERVAGSVAAAAWAIVQGAALVRVHDVAPVVAAARLASPCTSHPLRHGADHRTAQGAA